MNVLLALLIMATVNIDLSRDMNPHFQPLYYNTSRNLVLMGGAGSGKSHFAAQKLIARALAEPGHKILVTRATRPAVKESCFELIRHYLAEWGVPYKANKSDLDIEVGSSAFLFRGLDDPEKRKSIEGITLNWFEEPTELTPNKFQQLDLRMRGKPIGYHQNILTFNPVSQNNWMYGYFYGQTQANTTLDHSTYRDNEKLLAENPEYGAQLERYRELDYYYYQVYCLGEWGVLAGLIYDNWEVRHLDKPLNYYDAIVGGLDFGYNDPYTFAIHGIKDRVAYVIDEVYGHERTTPDIISEMHGLCAKYELDPGSFDIYADHEPDRIDEIHAAGFSGIREAEKSVPVFNQIAALKKIKVIVNDICTHTIRERDGYKWRQDKDGNLMDKPLEKDDHCMDRTRYALYSQMMGYGSQIFI